MRTTTVFLLLLFVSSRYFSILLGWLFSIITSFIAGILDASGVPPVLIAVVSLLFLLREAYRRYLVYRLNAILNRFRKFQWDHRDYAQWSLNAWDFPVDRNNPSAGRVIVCPLYVTIEGYASSRWVRSHPLEGVLFFDAPPYCAQRWYAARGMFSQSMGRRPHLDNGSLTIGPIRRLGTSSNVSKPTPQKPSSTSQVGQAEAPVPRQRTRPFLTFAEIRARPKAPKSLDGWMTQGNNQEAKSESGQSSNRPRRYVPPKPSLRPQVNSRMEFTLFDGSPRVNQAVPRLSTTLASGSGSSNPVYSDYEHTRLPVDSHMGANDPVQPATETVSSAQEPSHVSTRNEAEIAPPVSGTPSVAPAPGGHVSASMAQVPDTKTAMSPEDRWLYNLEPFLFHYRNELRTRLLCGHNITKAQLDWYNSPTSMLPLPTTLVVVGSLDKATIKPSSTPELTSGSSSLDSSPLGPASPASVAVQSPSDIRPKVPIADALPIDASRPCALASPSGAPMLGDSTAVVAAARSAHFPSSAIPEVQLDLKADRPVKPIGRKYQGYRRIQQPAPSPTPEVLPGAVRDTPSSQGAPHSLEGDQKMSDEFSSEIVVINDVQINRVDLEAFKSDVQKDRGAYTTATRLFYHSLVREAMRNNLIEDEIRHMANNDPNMSKEDKERDRGMGYLYWAAEKFDLLPLPANPSLTGGTTLYARLTAGSSSNERRKARMPTRATRRSDQ
ncbi:hypothetical protein FRC02_001937 [Tulasnella sp. 418]|nr:hypothetical protein FRC02_001937 [Tulasnella sp. 418]